MSAPTESRVFSTYSSQADRYDDRAHEVALVLGDLDPLVLVGDAVLPGDLERMERLLAEREDAEREVVDVVRRVAHDGEALLELLAHELLAEVVAHLGELIHHRGGLALDAVDLELAAVDA